MKKEKWLSDIQEVSFLAAGEYNENYVVRSANRSYVFRINHGSQLNIENQIEYEYWVLKNLEKSGVTPKPFFFESSPEHLDGGVLLMEYIQGIPLDYVTDSERAAYIFATVHSQPYSDNLIVQREPVLDIARESMWLINKYNDHPLIDVKTQLLKYHEKILLLAEKTRGIFNKEPVCIVNTEVNSKNFLIQGQSGYLVDWEKAVVSYRYQDFGHFVVPTTTLWKTDYYFDEENKKNFLRSYRKYINYPLTLSEIIEKTEILEQTILLRAMSWCFMAYYEYTQNNRQLKDNFTFNRIKKYMREAECFLK